MEYIHRDITNTLNRYLKNFPAIAILGPRQCGKSTLAKHITNNIKDSVYLDLERIGDRNKLSDPEMFFKINSDKLTCLDEIQKLPEIFSTIKLSETHNYQKGIADGLFNLGNGYFFMDSIKPMALNYLVSGNSCTTNQPLQP